MYLVSMSLYLEVQWQLWAWSQTDKRGQVMRSVLYFLIPKSWLDSIPWYVWAAFFGVLVVCSLIAFRNARNKKQQGGTERA
jgi:hypothetical protein